MIKNLTLDKVIPELLRSQLRKRSKTQAGDIETYCSRKNYTKSLPELCQDQGFQINKQIECMKWIVRY